MPSQRNCSCTREGFTRKRTTREPHEREHVRISKIVLVPSESNTLLGDKLQKLCGSCLLLCLSYLYPATPDSRNHHNSWFEMERTFRDSRRIINEDLVEKMYPYPNSTWIIVGGRSVCNSSQHETHDCKKATPIRARHSRAFNQFVATFDRHWGFNNLAHDNGETGWCTVIACLPLRWHCTIHNM